MKPFFANALTTVHLVSMLIETPFLGKITDADRKEACVKLMSVYRCNFTFDKHKADLLHLLGFPASDRCLILEPTVTIPDVTI